MSFSADIKDELSHQINGARHCQIAEIAAIIGQCGKIITIEPGKIELKLITENISVARKYFTLIKKTFNIVADVSIRNNRFLKRAHTYSLSITSPESVKKILSAVKIFNEKDNSFNDMTVINEIILINTCCKRAFLRGSFLAAGSVGNPEKAYHLEIVCSTMQKAEQLQKVIQNFDIEAKIVGRKNAFVVYIKEGAGIVEFLNVVEAHVALMNLENVRILKEMRNSVNRKVNCETANINKTITASLKQIEDIELIRETTGFSSLPDSLKEIALIRLDNPDTSLKELGEMLNPPVGKSGVNHRLRKISEIAEEIRKNR